MIEESIDLREYVAEQVFAMWCVQNGEDVSWNGVDMTAWQVEAWRAVADAAIAAVEWEHIILPNAGLLVAVYSDGVIDLRVTDDEDGGE